MSQAIANLCFPHIHDKKADILAQYPPRPQAQIVTRLAPSPTGFLHLGALYTGLINLKFAHQHKGIFMLRIEDTDQKRLVHDGIKLVIDSLSYFGIDGDESPFQP